MKNVARYVLSTFLITALAACGDNEIKPIEQAKGQKGGYAIKLDAPTYTQGDLDLLDNIKSNNTRRVRSLLDNDSATVYSADQDDMSGLMLAASLKNEEAVKIILDKTDQGDAKVLNRGNKDGKTPMIFAAEANSPEIIKLLRKKGADPNIYDANQKTPLLIAAQNNSLEGVRVILQDMGDTSPPANPDLSDSSGETAVLAATRNGNKEILKLLKDAGANLNQSNVEGTTPLIFATSQKNKELLDYLISLGADINQLGQLGKTPLIYALDSKDYDFAKYLLDKGANPNIHAKGLDSPLQIAVSTDNANVPLISYLISKGAKLNDADIPLGNVISRSIHKGNAPAIKELIAKGAKVSDTENLNGSGLTQALNIDDEDIAVLLIENGADINKPDEQGFTPLALASKKKFNRAMEALIKRGADVNQTSRNKTAIPLEIVIDNDNAELLETMFNNGLNANTDAILLRAVSGKKDNVISVALLHGARPNIMNTTGQPVLWLAVAKDDNAAVTSLINANALLDVQDAEKGLTPLSLSIIRGNADIANLLINKGANPDVVDNNGFSSLAYAAATGQVEIIKALLAHKASIDAVDKNGNTILQLVELSKLSKDKKDEVSKILKAAGAK